APDRRRLAAGSSGLRLDSTCFVPSPRRRLDGRGHLDARRFHRRFPRDRQYRPAGAGRRVPKCPDRAFAPDETRPVRPDAGIVHALRSDPRAPPPHRHCRAAILAAILAGPAELTDLAMAGPGPVSVGFKTAGKPGGAVLP
ncbi:MAG TPA: hypothetical protein VF113_12610, partial [Stellaceae bacterium]